jgi:hypothetical protein
LNEVLPIGRFFNLGRLVFVLGNFFYRKGLASNLKKGGLGYILGDFWAHWAFLVAKRRFTIVRSLRNRNFALHCFETTVPS